MSLRSGTPRVGWWNQVGIYKEKPKKLVLVKLEDEDNLYYGARTNDGRYHAIEKKNIKFKEYKPMSLAEVKLKCDKEQVFP